MLNENLMNYLEEQYPFSNEVEIIEEAAKFSIFAKGVTMFKAYPELKKQSGILKEADTMLTLANGKPSRTSCLKILDFCIKVIHTIENINSIILTPFLILITPILPYLFERGLVFALECGSFAIAKRKAATIIKELEKLKSETKKDSEKQKIETMIEKVKKSTEKLDEKEKIDDKKKKDSSLEESYSELEMKILFDEAVDVKGIASKVADTIKKLVIKMKEMFRMFQSKIIGSLRSKKIRVFAFNAEIVTKYIKTASSTESLLAKKGENGVEGVTERCNKQISDIDAFLKDCNEKRKKINTLSGYKELAESAAMNKINDIMKLISEKMQNAIKLTSGLEKQALADKDNMFGSIYSKKAAVANKYYAMHLSFARFTLSCTRLSLPTKEVK